MKARLGDLAEHVREDALDGGQSADLVEGILEPGIGAVELAEAGDVGGGKTLVEGDQFIEVLHLRLR